jgi:hypothetical protein
MTHIATLECSICSALILVYPQDQPADPGIGWSTVDTEACQAPPVDRCPHALTEVKRRFPELYR